MAFHPLDGAGNSRVPPVAELLAIDLGLRAGIALYSGNGRLMTYRSTNFGSVSRLKRAVPGIVGTSVKILVTEGDSRLAHIWEQYATRRGLICERVAPHSWRTQMYNLSEMRQKGHWKETADKYARRIIEWSKLSSPSSLRHDAAEAICLGMCAAINHGWLEQFPKDIYR